MTGHRATLPANQDSNLAAEAWEVHMMLVRLESMHPELATNPLWRLHRADAQVDFETALGADR